VAHGEPLSVKEFQDKLQGWRSEKKVPPPLTFEIEGRVLFCQKDRLRLDGLKDPPVLFLSKSELPVLNRKWATVVGKIHVDPRSGEYTFELSSAKESPSDLEKFLERKRKLRSAPAADWYELGRWAEVRAQFYKDDDLLGRSAKVFLHAIEMDRKERAKDDPEGLFELAEKAISYRLPVTLAQELTHEAFLVLVQRSTSLPAPALADLAERMAKKLPGALDPPPFTLIEVVNKYKTEPVTTYAGADPATRRKIHRLLYAGVLLRTIVPELAADGSNGFEVADKIDKLVPEQHRLAEEFRDRALKARAADVEKLTKSQMLDLVDQYSQRGAKQLGEQLLETWLTLRVRGLDPDDTEGLLELTEEYRRLLKRNDLADRLLIDGWKCNRQARDIAERLEKAGYRLFEGTWLTTEEFANRPEGQMEKDIRAGLPKKGMTTGQVSRSRGKPDSFSRAVTSGQVTELWSYSQSDGSSLVVRFVKRAGQTEATVADVVQVRTP
jgi:hypothetical protein